MCCLDVQGAGGMEGAAAFIADSRDKARTVAAAQEMLRAAHAARAAADELINRESRHWNTGRMAMVDRNILRLAVWELMTARAPRGVVIDEAIRLAKEFASAESPRFINGVLDAVAGRIEQERPDTETQSD